jgi:hypothetical protein
MPQDLSTSVRIHDVKTRGGELVKHLPGLIKEAARLGTSPSMVLEKADPTSDYTGSEARIDAFERACRAKGLVTQTNPALGIYADKWDRFLSDDEGRALFAIYAQREWAAAKWGEEVNTRNILTSTVDNVSANQRPYLDAALRDDLDGRADNFAPLSDLIAVETPIRGRSYQAVYLDESESSMGMRRVTEGAEIGKSILKLSEATFHLQKYGDSIEWTYEVDRQEGIDKIGFFIRQMARQNEYDKLLEIVSTLVNHAAVQVINLTTLDTTLTANATNTMTFRALASLQMEFNRGYMMSAVLGDKTEMLGMLMTPAGPNNTTLLAAGETPIGTFRKLGTQQAGDLVWSNVPNAPADTLVFFDRDSAVERISEIGAQISEMDNFITRQTKVMTFTENESFNVILPYAVKIVRTAL